MAERHVLGISGGKDSAALAIYMRQHHPELNIEYFFTDTGKELPEVYDFLGKLEGFLGKKLNISTLTGILIFGLRNIIIFFHHHRQGGVLAN